MAVSHTASLSLLSTALTPRVPKDGAPTKSLFCQPLAVGVSTDRRFLTSSSTFSTRWFLVHEALASEVVAVGVNNTSKSRLPARKSSSLVTSSAPEA
ncbi:hypothetical protein D3C73_1152560 [compost metagenome]